MKTAFWILLAALLTYVTAAALHNTAHSDDRETLVGNVLLSLSVGWYTVTSWRRAYLAKHQRPARGQVGVSRNAGS
ncbi:hypothetical protein ACFYW8_41115 [Streptomyces sp. NPDC002742]|jgi:hypothetical protein|uniref:hypothetical protein n=1 Tax=unclassified Streptomyces TaxID=2593676 RepID=UPI00341A85CF